MTQHPLSLPGFGRDLTPAGRLQRLIYPAQFGIQEACLTEMDGVDDCYISDDGRGVVVFTDGSSLSMAPSEPYSCLACGHTGLEPDGGGDACEACTVFADGEPCQTAEHGFTVAVCLVGWSEDASWAIDHWDFECIPADDAGLFVDGSDR